MQIAHVNPQVVTAIIKALSKEYGDIMPLSISRGEFHDYLGMVFDYTIDGLLLIQMYPVYTRSD